MKRTKDTSSQRIAGELPDDPSEGEVPMTDDTGEALPPLVSIATAIDEAKDLAQRRKDGKEIPVPLPWEHFNYSLKGGMWPGLHILVGSTGAGKTAFSLAVALHAAQNGHHVLYVGLELDPPQIAMRLAARMAEDERAARGRLKEPIRWSDAYFGKLRGEQKDLLNDALEKLATFPIDIEQAPAGGWSSDVLLERCKSMKPLEGKTPLVVVDFLQLVGGDERELRERIGKAAYNARMAARDHHVAVLVISSTARDKYALLENGIEQAGLVATEKTKTSGEKEQHPYGYILSPGVLVGLGKESGEIEYAADSVTVLARYPSDNPNHSKIVQVAVPKLRYGPPSWFALNFFEGDFKQRADALPPLPEKTKSNTKGRTKKSDEKKKPVENLKPVEKMTDEEARKEAGLE